MKKELTKEERRGERAFEAWKKLTENIANIRKFTIENAKLFTEIYDNQWQKDILGDEEASWVAFLAQPEVFYTRSEINRFMILHKTLSVEWGFVLEDLLDIPITKLENIARYCKSSSEAQHYLDLARTFSSADWKEEMNKLVGKPSAVDCNHVGLIKKYAVCSKCGNKHPIE